DRCDTIHIPGKAPIKLPEGIQHTAHAFTADGLLCTAYRYGRGKNDAGQNAVVFFPIDREKGQLGEVKLLRSWFGRSGAGGFVPEFSHGRVFHRGDFLAYTGTVVPAEVPLRKGATRNVTEVWDARNDKLVWRELGVLEAADDKYAYL